MRRVIVAVVCAVAMGLAAGQGQALNRQSLTQQARQLAAHGGIRSSRYGDATPRLKALTAELIRRRFRAAGWGAVARALCIARRESGLNPGAVSSTQDYGVSQIHVAAHPEYSAYRLTRDPVYSVNAFWRLSNHGRDWSPWNGGRYACA